MSLLSRCLSKRVIIGTTKISHTNTLRYQTLLTARLFSSTTIKKFNDAPPLGNTNLNGPQTPSTDILAAKERIANRDLGNPAVQADFYRTLLQANYPQIVVSRYESPGIAANDDCTHLYIAALERMGQYTKANQVAAASASVGASAGASASAGSATDPFSHPRGANGSKAEPLYVVVTESYLTLFTKLLRVLLPLLAIGYAVRTGAEFLSESGSILRADAGKPKDPDAAQSDVRFSDVHGVDEARDELQEIVEFLKDPAKFTGLGGKLPKGVLLTGPPGTGKTLLARATAGEAGVPFFFMSGSEFDELYVGVGAKRVRELFAAARAKSPAIVFIDELDAIGGKRNPRDQAYAKQTLNQLLVELDGFSQSSGIIIIGATNFPESLDKALTRPGRFDKIVNVELPDVRGRADILRHHMKHVACGADVDPTLIARGTPGLSGAELMNLVNEAAIHASRQNALAVTMTDFEWAKDKILLGAARKSMVMTEAARISTAYHEAGHAIMAMYTPGATALYKATILPRGRALGVTFQLPEMDKIDTTKQECRARLDVCLGGKVAEEIVYGPENTTSGCGSDLASATQTARAMVTQYGMSERIGPVRLADEWESWSPKLRDMADAEVREMLLAAEERTRKLLAEKSLELQRLARGLLEYETLTREEMEKIVKGEPLDKEKLVSNTVVKGGGGRETSRETDLELDNGVVFPVIAAEG